MKITKEVLLRVEGEALLELDWNKGVIEDAKIILPSSRGIEKILKSRPAMDALVITPRVCGICGHAHLMASVGAIENAMPKVGLSEKAKLVRDITLISEIIQNHIKWFYLFIVPDVLKFKSIDLLTPLKGKRWFEAVKVSGLTTRIIALFGGQWPHSSYAVPGGVTSDFTEREISKALSILKEVRTFFLEKTIDMQESEFANSLKKTHYGFGGDLGIFLDICADYNLVDMGKSYNRFITGGEIFPCVEPAHYTGSRRLCYMNMSCVREIKGEGYSKAPAVRYRDLPYETGPLARQFLSGNAVVKSIHKKHRDSYITRVVSRVLEIGVMCIQLEEKLRELYHHIDEPSYIEPSEDLKNLSGEGAYAVEAARGTLIHRLTIEKGRISEYSIITPSQWNLGPRAGGLLGVAERALIGLDDSHKAQMVVRSFDMCSVCTTH